MKLFVTSKSNLFIREIAELLCAGFRAAGHEAQLCREINSSRKTEEGKIQIVVTPHEFFNLFLRDKLSLEKVQRLTIIFLLSIEQPESEWFDSNLVMAPHCTRHARHSFVGRGRASRLRAALFSFAASVTTHCLNKVTHNTSPKETSTFAFWPR